MSDDLKRMLHDLAREPRRSLDMPEVKRAANRAALRDRAVAASTAVALAAGGYAGWATVHDGEQKTLEGPASAAQCNPIGRDIRVFLNDDVNEERAAALEGRFQQLPGVADVNFTSSSEALEDLREEFPDRPDLWENFGSDSLHPLPASFTLKLADRVDARKVSAMLPPRWIDEVVLVQPEGTQPSDACDAIHSQ
jgi:hypothetical protein